MAQPVKTFDIGGVEFKFIAVPAGQASIGLPKDEVERINTENMGKISAVTDSWPEQPVKTDLFWILNQEISELQWAAVMDPGQLQTARDEAKTKISYEHIQAFMTTLAEKAGFSRGVFRLPTEPEFEVAAKTVDPSGSKYSTDTKYRCFDREARSISVLRDEPDTVVSLLGGVWEITGSDYLPYEKKYAMRVEHGKIALRGGCNACQPHECLPASRWGLFRDNLNRSNVGFRPVALFQNAPSNP